MKAPCAKCGKLSKFSRKPMWENWVYCTRCQRYTVPKIRRVK